MSSTGSKKHNKRLASEADASQKLLDTGPVQNLRLKERQRFSEEVRLQDGDRLPSAHLQVDRSKPPMGSISSMEVNVDVLEQMDLMDVSDHEALDVFLSEGAGEDEEEEEEEEEEEDEDEEDEELHRERVPLRSQREVSCGSFSASSGSSGTSAGRAETPVIQSDEEEVHADNVLLTCVPQSRDQETDEEDDGERCN